MYKGSSSRVIPIVLVIIVIAIAIAVLVTVARTILGGGSTDKEQTDAGRQSLLMTTDERGVRMTVRGPIVASEEFRSYQVAVTPSSRSLTIYKGYLGQVTDTKELGNNVKAYEEFVYALDKANLMDGTALEGDKDDTRGICATGFVYEFEVLKGDSTVERLWTSTCNGSRGSLKGSVTQDRSLFMNQIPGSTTLVSEVDL